VGPLDKDVVRDDALFATADGFALEIHSHWYRALPLTSLAVVDLSIDGERVDPAALTVEANGKTYPFDQLEDRYDDWWFTTDAVTLHIPRANAPANGSHRIELDLGLSIPYLIVGRGEDRKPLLASSHTDRTVVATERKTK
jgi:Domain of unknown function (DUF6379)